MSVQQPVERLVERDTFAEMVALLEPVELLIACLRLEDLSDDQIASLLDVDRCTVHGYMEQALQRIVAALPELGVVLRDRRHPPQRGLRPLARGWICPSDDEPHQDDDVRSQCAKEGEPPQGGSPVLAALDAISRATRRPPGRYR